jgi:hypothetical protein
MVRGILDKLDNSPVAGALRRSEIADLDHGTAGSG